MNVVPKKYIFLLLTVALLTVAVCGIGFFWIRAYSHRMWEAVLAGPYAGHAYEERISGEPSSQFKFDGRTNLEIYEVKNLEAPILVCRSNDGTILSKTLLSPTQLYKDGSSQTFWVKDMKLQKEYDGIGIKINGKSIFLTCEWEYGGKEGGVLVLNEDHTFKELWLGW